MGNGAGYYFLLIPILSWSFDWHKILEKDGNLNKGNPEIPKFAFVNFTTESSALKAIDADGRIRIENHNLHTESRKPKGCVKGCVEEPNEVCLVKDHEHFNILLYW